MRAAIYLTVLLSLLLQHAQLAYAKESIFNAGLYEGLMLAIDSNKKISGYYREEQGEGVTKVCSFFLSGKATGTEVDVATWNEELLPGQLKAMKNGVIIKVPKAREHPGCGLVLLPQIAEGMSLTRLYPTKWQEIRVISSPRAYLHSDAAASKKSKAYLVKGDVVGVLSNHGEWLKVEYIGGKTRTRGWILGSHTMTPSPPLPK